MPSLNCKNFVAEKRSQGIKNRKSKNRSHCLFCGNKSDIIWVHGHGQCSVCGINVDECCRGERCG